MSLKDALTAVKNAAVDLTTLDVQTYTGTIDLSTATGGFGGIKDLVKDAASQTDAKITLVAQSVYEFDGDSFNFLTDGNGLSPDALKIHNEAVAAGLKARQGLLDLFKDLVLG